MYSAGIKAKKRAVAVLAVILAVILAISLISSLVTAYSATVDYYEVKVGNNTFATVPSKAQANEIIEGVRKHYLANATDIASVAEDPVMTVNQRTYRVKTDQLPELATNTEEVIDELVAGRTIKTEYTAKKGDTLENVTNMLGCTEEQVTEQNEAAAIQDLEPGTQYSYTWVVPYVEVKVEKFVDHDEEIPFNTVYEETGTLYVGEESLKQEGVPGVKRVTERQLLVNGEVQHSEVYKEEVITAPVNKVIFKGVRRTSDDERQRIVNYALQFVGNPYRYGGTSLTEGCDCSGFIYRVFQDCGYTGVPRVGVEYVYPTISASELLPGDVTVYGTHYALYIGNGMEVSAVNESQGIRTHPMYYSNSDFVCGVRIIQ